MRPLGPQPDRDSSRAFVFVPFSACHTALRSRMLRSALVMPHSLDGTLDELRTTTMRFRTVAGSPRGRIAEQLEEAFLLRHVVVAVIVERRDTTEDAPRLRR
jgi:hypothetical protein